MIKAVKAILHHSLSTNEAPDHQYCFKGDTAIKVGVPNLETDLFTNVNKLCPSCDTQSAQAGKLLGNVPKPVPNLCMSCVQAWILLAHWSYCLGTSCTLHRYCLDTPCTLELLLGHSLYTTQVLLGYSLCTTQVLLGYSLCTFSITIWALLVHYRGTVSVLLAH